MNTNTTTIKQIIQAFSNVISIHENGPQWVKRVTAEDIKIAFKLGLFVEKSMNKFQTEGCSELFLKILNRWDESKNKNYHYSNEFYSKICDKLLLIFFKNKSVNTNTLDIAIRMYTSLFNRSRLKDFIQNLMMTSASLEAIVDFTQVNSPHEILKYELILNQWLEKSDQSFIADALNTHKVAKYLPLLIGILSLDTRNSLTDLILNDLLIKMLDRSVISKEFWLVLLRQIDQSCLGQVCCNYEEFLASLVNFLIYLGGMMEEKEINGETCWVSDSQMSICHEITHTELELFFIFLIEFKGAILKDYIMKRICDAQINTKSSLWQHLKFKCV